MNRLSVWGKTGGKIARKGKGKGRREPVDKHLRSVRSLSVNQFRAWVTPGKINRKWVVFCSVWKQREMEHEPHCWFCKKSLISGKRIENKPFVLLVRFGILTSRRANLECGRYRYYHDFSRTWSFEDKYKEISSASIADRNYMEGRHDFYFMPKCCLFP